MKKIITILFILLLGITSCKKETQGTIEFKNSAYSECNIPIISVKVDSVDVLFILDTGANSSLIDSDFYRNNKNLFTYSRTINVQYTGIGGSTGYKDQDIVVASTNIGDVVFIEQDLSSVINSVKDYKIKGVIGSSFFKLNPSIIDYHNRCLYFSRIEMDSLKLEI